MMIRLVAMDVDGTLTDGGFYMDGEREFKKFNVRDGYGIAEMQRAGIEVAFISGRYSAATDARAKNLSVSRVVNGTDDKLGVLESMAAELGLSSGEVAFIGDDVPDIPCIAWAGSRMAVGDAAEEVKAAAGVVLNSSGGHGAVREAAGRILKINEGSGAK
jgi:3-deoxy-D-manno-octulosonate 8-phosphate phosphatase (KDO 8-P phosphatase)